MNRTRYIILSKHISYSALFLILYVIQTVPSLFMWQGVKPIWVLPAAIALAMFEGEFLGGVYGAAAGLLCDMGSFLLFGFNGFFTCLYCIAVGLLVIYLMRCNLLGCILFSTVFMLIRGSLEFLFAYGMWGFEGVSRLYFTETLPAAAFSVVISPASYLAVRTMHRKFKLLLES